MSQTRIFSLDSVRADGWFERVGQGIGSFRTLCDILGERFFAFSMITGARITALTVDRRNPDDTMVDFVVGAEAEEEPAETQRLPLPDFRRRLVAALLTEGPGAPPPTRDTDTEGLQLHIGVRYILLSPLFGFSLKSVEVDDHGSHVIALVDGREMRISLPVLQQRLRALVRDELERASRGQRSTIDLAHVSEATEAADQKNWRKVVQLLGSWPAPLAIFMRTPEGQALPLETASLIAKGLGLLGDACVALDEVERAEEVYRLGVQYAHDSTEAAIIFRKFGEALLTCGRPGEAVGLLRRAAALGAPAPEVQPLLAEAFLQRRRFVAALVCLRTALEAGVPHDQLAESMRQVELALGSALPSWRNALAPHSA